MASEGSEGVVPYIGIQQTPDLWNSFAWGCPFNPNSFMCHCTKGNSEVNTTTTDFEVPHIL